MSLSTWIGEERYGRKKSQTKGATEKEGGKKKEK